MHYPEDRGAVILTFSDTNRMQSAERLLDTASRSKVDVMRLENPRSADLPFIRARADRCVELRARARTLWILSDTIKTLLNSGQCAGAAKQGEAGSYRFGARLASGTIQFLGYSRERNKVWIDLVTCIEGYPEHHYEVVQSGEAKLAVQHSDGTTCLRQLFQAAIKHADAGNEGQGRQLL